LRVTKKGQVTIPQQLREKFGIAPKSEVEFIEENGRIFIVPKEGQKMPTRKFRRLRGIATVKMTTDEIMALTRGKE